MIKKRSSFWTVVFSFLPGAGHMFMGFMKQGVSLMSVFFFVCFLSSWLQMGPLMFVIPVLWFYSFFDVINKMTLPDAEFYAQEDYYFLSVDKVFTSENKYLKNRKMLAGSILILAGVYFLWVNIFNTFYSYFPDDVKDAIWSFNGRLPQFIFSLVIVVIGVRLIMGKRKETGSNG